MDELKICSKFMKSVLSGVLKMMIKRNFGYDVKVVIEDFNITYNDGKAHIHINADAEMNKDELTRMLVSAGIG